MSAEDLRESAQPNLATLVDATDGWSGGGRGYQSRVGVVIGWDPVTRQPITVDGVWDPDSLHWTERLDEAGNVQVVGDGRADRRMAVKVLLDHDAPDEPPLAGEAPYGQRGGKTARDRSTRVADRRGRMAVATSLLRVVSSEQDDAVAITVDTHDFVGKGSDPTRVKVSTTSTVDPSSTTADGATQQIVRRVYRGDVEIAAFDPSTGEVFPVSGSTRTQERPAPPSPGTKTRSGPTKRRTAGMVFSAGNSDDGVEAATAELGTFFAPEATLAPRARGRDGGKISDGLAARHDHLVVMAGDAAEFVLGLAAAAPEKQAELEKKIRVNPRPLGAIGDKNSPSGSSFIVETGPGTFKKVAIGDKEQIEDDYTVDEVDGNPHGLRIGRILYSADDVTAIKISKGRVFKGVLAVDRSRAGKNTKVGGENVQWVVAVPVDGKIPPSEKPRDTPEPKVIPGPPGPPGPKGAQGAQGAAGAAGAAGAGAQGKKGDAGKDASQFRNGDGTPCPNVTKTFPFPLGPLFPGGPSLGNIPVPIDGFGKTTEDDSDEDTVTPNVQQQEEEEDFGHAPVETSLDGSVLAIGDADRLISIVPGGPPLNGNVATRPIVPVGARGGGATIQDGLLLSAYQTASLQDLVRSFLGGPGYYAGNVAAIHRNTPGNPPAPSILGQWVSSRVGEDQQVAQRAIEFLSRLDSTQGGRVTASTGSPHRTAVDQLAAFWFGRDNRGRDVVDDRPVILIDTSGREGGYAIATSDGDTSRFNVDGDGATTTGSVTVGWTAQDDTEHPFVVGALDPRTGTVPVPDIYATQDGAFYADGGQRVMTVDPNAVDGYAVVADSSSETGYSFSATGGGGGITDFPDDQFRVHDDADATAGVTFDLSQVTPGSDAVLTIPDASGTIVLQGDVVTFAALEVEGNVVVDGDFECDGDAHFLGDVIIDGFLDPTGIGLPSRAARPAAMTMPGLWVKNDTPSLRFFDGSTDKLVDTFGGSFDDATWEVYDDAHTTRKVHLDAGVYQADGETATLRVPAMGGSAGPIVAFTGNPTRGCLPVGNSAGTGFNRLARGAQYTVLQSDGTDTVFGAVNLAQGAATTGVLPYDRGGTAQSSYAKGDMIYASAINTLAKRAAGSTGDVWTMQSDGTPDWEAPSGGGGGSPHDLLDGDVDQDTYSHAAADFPGGIIWSDGTRWGALTPATSDGNRWTLGITNGVLVWDTYHYASAYRNLDGDQYLGAVQAPNIGHATNDPDNLRDVLNALIDSLTDGGGAGTSYVGYHGLLAGP